MISRKLVAAALSASLVAVFVACSDSETDVTPSPSTPGTDAATDTGNNNTTDPDSATPTNDGGVDAAPAECSAARETLMKPVDKVSTGEITVLETNGTTVTLLIDGTAGGGGPTAAMNPRIYINLETRQRVDVTDKTAATSNAWDLAIKRPVLFTNSGDGGGGQGGAVLITKAFDAVTVADAAGKTFAPESFLDLNCNPKVDQTNAIRTSFDGWYDYDLATNVVTPRVNTTWIVRGANGTKLFKLALLNFYSLGDGGVGGSANSARYTVKLAPLN